MAERAGLARPATGCNTRSCWRGRSCSRPWCCWRPHSACASSVSAACRRWCSAAWPSGFLLYVDVEADRRSEQGRTDQSRSSQPGCRRRSAASADFSCCCTRRTADGCVPPPLVRRSWRRRVSIAVLWSCWRWRRFVAGCWMRCCARANGAAAELPEAAASRSSPSRVRASRKGADAAAGDRDQLRLHQQARVRRRQRADLLFRHDARGRPGDLRRNHQADARRRQRPADRARRPDHLRRPDGSERRFPRRLRRFAAPRDRRTRPGWRRRAPTAAAAISRCSRAASTPPASRARTIRRSRRSGRSRRRGSSTTPARR